jgi:uncharacterized phage-associated protein
MPHRSVAIANEFLKLPGARETLTQMQLQKLAYIAHGWNWAVSGEPLIAEPVEAWAYGPVYRALYEHTKFYGKEPVGRLISPDDHEMARFFLDRKADRRPPYKADLTDRERQVIRHVWNRYGKLNAIQLSQLTHQRGTPWFETFTNRGRDGVIAEALIRTHYQLLAEEARDDPEEDY